MRAQTVIYMDGALVIVDIYAAIEHLTRIER
jgi:hypothetical protein